MGVCSSRQSAGAAATKCHSVGLLSSWWGESLLENTDVERRPRYRSVIDPPGYLKFSLCSYSFVHIMNAAD